MKAVIGVDAEGAWKAAAGLLLRLKFPLESLVLVHAVEPIPTSAAAPEVPGFEGVGDAFAASEDVGRRILHEAADLMKAEAAIEQRLVLGAAAGALCDVADDVDADLIAVATHVRGSLERFLAGSTTVGLLRDARMPVLAAKPGQSAKPQLSAVFVSETSEAGIDAASKLVKLAPEGIDTLHVLADPNDQTDLCEALQTVSPTCLRAHIDGSFEHSIEALIKSSEADLLILEGQPHTWMERLRHKDNAYHQAIETANSVLILR